jgi:hypothetical protein
MQRSVVYQVWSRCLPFSQNKPRLHDLPRPTWFAPDNTERGAIQFWDKVQQDFRGQGNVHIFVREVLVDATEQGYTYLEGTVIGKKPTPPDLSEGGQARAKELLQKGRELYEARRVELEAARPTQCVMIHLDSGACIFDSSELRAFEKFVERYGDALGYLKRIEIPSNS